MSGAHLLRVCGAETSKLFSRLTARVGLVLVAVAALLAVLFLRWIDESGLEYSVGGAVSTLGDTYDYDGATGPLAALVPRNVFFVGRMVLVALVALSAAGEYRGRTLREDALRPVPRWAVPVAKWVALCAWSAASLLVALLFSAGLSVPLFGAGGSWLHIAIAYGGTFIGDCALAAIVLLAAFALRSVVATIVTGFLFWMVNTLPMWGLWALQKVIAAFGAVEYVKQVRGLRVWLPGSALDTWVEYWLDGVWAWQSFLVLGLMLVLGLVGSALVFRRIDVP